MFNKNTVIESFLFLASILAQFISFLFDLKTSRSVSLGNVFEIRLGSEKQFIMADLDDIPNLTESSGEDVSDDQLDDENEKGN